MPATKKLEVTVRNNAVQIGPHLTITFKRTLRIPDDGKLYPLPPSLGNFPVHRIDDYRSNVPDAWRDHGGVFLPMWQREAMWLAFNGASFRPYALKVAVGKVNALSGEPYDQGLHGAGGRDETQDYMVVPGQPWLDGINVGDGIIRQFVAMPLGGGHTVEGQVTGEELFGGVQLVAFDTKPGRFPTRAPQSVLRGARSCFGGQHVNCSGAFSGPVFKSLAASPPEIPEMLAAADSLAARGIPSSAPIAAEMGLGAGGQMEQKIYPDPHGPDVWDMNRFGRVYVHLVNSQMYREITGRQAPPSPVDPRIYARHGYPWFEMYDEGCGDIPASAVLGGVKSVKEVDEDNGLYDGQDDTTVWIPGSQVHPSHKQPSVAGWPKDPYSVSDHGW